MRNYYYSKFDNVNWGWWRNASIAEEELSVLEYLNRQMMSYLPSNMLVFNSNDEFFILVSERSQIDRDNAGRAFSFRNFRIAGRNEIKTQKQWLELLQNFSNPIDYRFPESINLPLAVASSFDVTLEQRIFESVFEYCFTGNKYCIKYEAVSRISRRSPKEISNLNFSNFPEAELFISTLQLLPFSILSRISFCLNYEDDFVNIQTNKLSFIDIIYCGNKTLVSESFHLDEKINFSILERQGFSINDISMHSPADGKWAELFRFLTKGKNSLQYKELHTIFERYFTTTKDKTVQELTTVYLDLYRLTDVENTEVCNLSKLLDITANENLHPDDKKVLLGYALRKLDIHNLINDLTALSNLFKKFGMTSQFDAAIVEGDFLSTHKNPLGTTISRDNFADLSTTLKKYISKLVLSQKLTISDLNDKPFMSVYKEALKMSDKETDLVYLWQELNITKDVLTNDQYESVRWLYNWTKDNSAYSKFLEKQYHANPNSFIRKELKNNKFTISLPSIDRINSVRDCLVFYKETDSSSEGLYLAEALKKAQGQIVDFIQNYNDFLFLLSAADLPTVDFIKETPLHDLIKKRTYQWMQETIQADKLNYEHTIEALSNNKTGREFLQSLFRENSRDISDIADTAEKSQRLIEIFKILKIKPEYWIKKLALKQRHKSFFLNIKRSDIASVVVISTLAILIIWPLVYTDNDDLDNQTKPSKNFAAPPTVKPELVDSNKIVLDSAQEFINRAFFKDTAFYNFLDFRKKRRAIMFLKFDFQNDNFSKYIIRKVDTINGNVLWNKFVKQYNDSLIKKIQLETKVIPELDPSNRAYHIKILAK